VINFIVGWENAFIRAADLVEGRIIARCAGGGSGNLFSLLRQDNGAIVR